VPSRRVFETDQHGVWVDTGAIHGWNTVMGSGKYNTTHFVTLDDYYDNWPGGYKADWDAIRIYFNQ